MTETSSDSVQVVGVFASALRRPWITLGVLGIFSVAGLAGGLARQPQFSATAQIAVGSRATAAQAVPGYVAAQQTLAGSYSRLAGSTVIAEQVARALRTSVGDVQSRLVATPVPESPQILITATGKDAKSAIALANADADALIAASKVSGSTASELLNGFRLAQRTLGRAQARVSRLVSTNAPSNDLVAARADSAAAQLRADAAAAQYTQQSQATQDPPLQMTSEAAGAASDRTTKIMQGVVVGAGAGILLALALATFLANRPLIRAQRV